MSTSGRRTRSLTEALDTTTPTEPEPPHGGGGTPPSKPPRPKLVSLQLYVTPEDHQRLKDISYHTKTSIQQLGIEALNLLMEKRGHAPLAPTTASRPTGRNVG